MQHVLSDLVLPIIKSILKIFSFRCVVKGNHTLFREYNFIHATPHNRASFIAMFWKCFKHIGQSGGKKLLYL